MRAEAAPQLLLRELLAWVGDRMCIGEDGSALCKSVQIGRVTSAHDTIVALILLDHYHDVSKMGQLPTACAASRAGGRTVVRRRVRAASESAQQYTHLY